MSEYKTGSSNDPNKDRYARTIDGRVIYYSPSSAAAFTGCNLWWWYSKVMGEKEPPSPALDYGNAVHLVLETYLETGATPPAGVYRDDRGGDIVVEEEHITRASTSLDLLPPPGTGHVEMWARRTPVYDGPEGLMLFAGKIDWHSEGGEWDVVDGWEGLHILDHKTKSSERGKYGVPEPEELARDRQGLLYAAVLTLDEPRDVLFSHNYILKKGKPRAKRVDAVMRKEDILRTWEAQATVAERMLQISRLELAEEVPHNLGFCHRYGRQCPMADRCVARKNTAKTTFSAFRNFDADVSTTQNEESPMSFWDMFEDAAAPAPKVSPTLRPPQAEEPEVRVLPDDAAPHNNDHVSKAFLQDAIQIVRASYQQQRDSGKNPTWSLVTIGNILAREGLDKVWSANVAYLAEIEVIEQSHVDRLGDYPTDQVYSVPAETLFDMGGNVDEDRAIALSACPTQAFRIMAQKSPRKILLLARPHCEGQKLAIIDDLLDDGRLKTPFDNHTPHNERAALREMYVLREGGDDLSDDTVDATLKKHGVYKRRNKKKISSFRDIVLVSPASEDMVVVEDVDESLSESDALAARTVEELIAVLTKDLGDSIATHAEGLLQVRDAMVSGRYEEDIEVAKADLKECRSELQDAMSAIQELKHSAQSEAAPKETTTPAVKLCTIYAGCRPIGPFGPKVPHIKEVLSVVDDAANRRVRMLDGHANLDHWTLADYGKGKTLFIEELRRFLTNNDLPDGEWWYPRNSVYEGIPIAEMFEAAGARLVTTYYGG